MDVVVVVKPHHLHGEFLGRVLAAGRARAHRVRTLDKPDFLRTPLTDVHLVCLKNHADDDRVWRAITRAGVRAVNRRLPCSRRSEIDALAGTAGVRTPGSAREDREVEELRYPVIRKAASLFAAADVKVLDRPPPRPDCSRYFYQELVPHRPVTSKVYCIGADAFLVEEEEDHARPYGRGRRRRAALPGALADAARAVGAATGLEVYGVDFVGEGRDQLLVDVNPFPGFRHVDQAADTLWTYLEGASRC